VNPGGSGPCSAAAAAIDAAAVHPSAGPSAGPAPRRRGRPKGSVNGSGPWSGRRQAQQAHVAATPQARTTATLVLESLSGVRSAPQAAQALGVTLARYYVLEAKAIAGLLHACEPTPPGPPPGEASERALARLQATSRQQEQELLRLRAVLRTTERGLGLPPPARPAGKQGKPSRARRPVVRALTVVRRLMAQAAPPAGPPEAAPAAGSAGAGAVVERISTTVPAADTPASGPGGG